jgi:hypothetical protein
VGQSVMNGALRDTRRTPGCIVAWPGMGTLPGRRSISPLLVGPKWMPKTLLFSKRRVPSREPPDRVVWRAPGQENSRTGGFGRGNWAGTELCEPRGSGREIRHSGFAETQKEPVRGCQAACRQGQVGGGQWPDSAASGQPKAPARNSKYGWARGTHSGGLIRHGCTWSLGWEGRRLSWGSWQAPNLIVWHPCRPEG